MIPPPPPSFSSGTPTHFAAARRLFAPFAGGTLFVGFSGGADSTAALLTALELQKEFGYALVAVHFDHGLRGEESRREAESARRFARRRGLPFRRIALDLNPAAPELEERARLARLAEWRKLTAETPKCAVVLGHHADDRVETLLMRLARGSNVSGAVSPRASAEIEGVRFLRPLLWLTRREVEAFLRSRRVYRWAVDSSNLTGEMTRNYLRNELLPALYRRLPGSREGMLRALEVLELDAECLEAEAERFLDSPGAESLTAWRELHPALLPRVLRRFAGIVPPADALRRFARELERPASPEPRLLPLAAGVELRLQHGRISRVDAPPADGLWEVRRMPEFRWGEWIFTARLVPPDFRPASPAEALFDAGRLPGKVRIAPLAAGETMIPFGGKTPVKIKKLRADRGIPAAEAPPAVRDPESGEILWAPRIRHGARYPAVPGGAALLLAVAHAERSTGKNNGKKES